MGGAPAPVLLKVCCPRCGRWLFSAAGAGTVVELPCRSSTCGGAIVHVEDIHAPQWRG